MARKAIIFVFILSLLPLIPLLGDGFPQTHDWRIHVARIANFSASLSEGNLVPRWAANLNWGYGHPILQFIYPLPSYIASLLHYLGLTFVDSTKVIFALSYSVSLLAMFLWVRQMWGTKAGMLAAVLYGFAPYRFVDLYVRGAIGEHMAFIFPPLMCYFILRMKEPHKKWMLGLALSTAGLILAHNALSIAFLPVVALYGLTVAQTLPKRRHIYILTVLFSFLMAFALTSFFLLPALLEAKYTLQDKITEGVLSGNYVPFSWFIYSPWSYEGSTLFSKSVGFIQWAGVILALIHLRQLKEHKRTFISLFLGLFIFSLFMMTEASHIIWESFPLLEKFQFPWRLLSLTVFVSSVVGAYVFSKLSRFWTIVFMIVAVAVTVPMWKPQGLVREPEAAYTGIFDSTTDSGELSPIWSVRFMEVAPPQRVWALGDATIDELDRTTTGHSFRVSVTDETKIIDNTLYFPGWHVFIDGMETEIQFQDPAHRGLITFMVPSGEHIVTVRFTDTKIRSIANILSLVSLGAIVLWLIKR